MHSDASMYRRIIVAMDFSSHAEAALQQAIWLARLGRSKIVLMHALRDLHQVVHRASADAKLDLLEGEGEVFNQEVCHAANAKMSHLIMKYGANDLDIEIQTVIGEPFVEVIKACEVKGDDLVLSGTRGNSVWKELLVGSTAVRLVRKCPANVWVVKAEHVGPPKIVLAAIDFSEASVKAAAQAGWIAQQSSAELHLLHVIDTDDLPTAVEEYVDREKIHRAVETRMQGLLNELQVAPLKVQIHVVCGSPWQEVKQLAQRLGVDLIAMGTVGRSGIPGLLMGNTAEKVLHTSNCSILTVKPDGFKSPVVT